MNKDLYNNFKIGTSHCCGSPHEPHKKTGTDVKLS